MDSHGEVPGTWLRLTPRWGDDIYDPGDEQLWAALQELDTEETEDEEGLPIWERRLWERETALAWRDGTYIWFFAAFVDGSVVFGEAESGDEYALPYPISRECVMHFWRLLRSHNIGQIRSEPWQPRTYER